MHTAHQPRLPESIGAHSPDQASLTAVSGTAESPSDEVSVGAVLRHTDEFIGSAWFWSDEAHNELSLMPDDQLESRITHCGIQMQAAYKLGMKGEAHRWRQQQEAALRERHRRPELVARLERERGLA